MKLKKKERVQLVMDVLDRLYPDTPIPLEHRDPYTLLVAVVLSAQCTDARVNTVTPELFALADNAEAMTKIDTETIRQIIKPCGLSNNKAKAISGLSGIITEQYGGVVPDSLEELEKLPGVGHKTASVVVSQAYGRNAFPVDTHIHRLMTRWKLTSGKNVVQTEKDAKRLFPEEKWNKLHLQIIYFGREYCPARGHEPMQCPICSQL